MEVSGGSIVFPCKRVFDLVFREIQDNTYRKYAHNLIRRYYKQTDKSDRRKGGCHWLLDRIGFIRAAMSLSSDDDAARFSPPATQYAVDDLDDLDATFRRERDLARQHRHEQEERRRKERQRRRKRQLDKGDDNDDDDDGSDGSADLLAEESPLPSPPLSPGSSPCGYSPLRKNNGGGGQPLTSAYAKVNSKKDNVSPTAQSSILKKAGGGRVAESSHSPNRVAWRFGNKNAEVEERKPWRPKYDDSDDDDARPRAWRPKNDNYSDSDDDGAAETTGTRQRQLLNGSGSSNIGSNAAAANKKGGSPPSSTQRKLSWKGDKNDDDSDDSNGKIRRVANQPSTTKKANKSKFG